MRTTRTTCTSASPTPTAEPRFWFDPARLWIRRSRTVTDDRRGGHGEVRGCATGRDRRDHRRAAAVAPGRHHLGITAFGATAWTGREAGDRIINEHDEADEDEELYVVLSGRARFELDGDAVDAPAGTFVFAGTRREADGVRRGAWHDARRDRRAPGAGVSGERLGALGPPRPPLRGRRVRGGGRPRRALVEAQPTYPRSSTTSRAARASPAGRPTRSHTSSRRLR